MVTRRMRSGFLAAGWLSLVLFVMACDEVDEIEAPETLEVSEESKVQAPAVDKDEDKDEQESQG